MNRIIKTVLKVSLVMAVIAGSFSLANPAQAAIFNSDPSDFATFRAANSNTQQGTTNWTTSVSANAGETVAFIISFHNTSSETAVGTTVRSILPTQSFSSATVFGEVFAQNAPSTSNGVSVNLTSSQSLSFVPGTVQFYKGLNATAQSIPFGQSGSEVVSSSGLRLGDIATGERGYVVFRALVGSSQPPQGQAPIVSTLSATNVAQNSATLNGTVNPNGANTNAWFEYGTTSSLGSTIGNQSLGSGNSSVNMNFSLSGLQSNTTYFYRIVAQNSAGTSQGSILNFTTSGSQGQAPIVNTYNASNISSSMATLNGSVNANNSSASFWFEYGTTQSFGYTTASQFIGSGTSAVNVNSVASGLQSNTTYYFRIMAQNSFGTVSGSTLSFTTSGAGTQGQAPIVSTNNATSISSNSVTLNGTVNPNNSFTNAWFEYGTTPSLGSVIGNQSVSSGNNSINISATLSGLSSNTTYYYRAVAQNSYGTSQGAVISFTTSGGGVIVGTAPTVSTNVATSISQNSALLNASVNPNNSNTNIWFEYGFSQSLGFTTGYQNAGSSNFTSNISANLTGLNSNTTYYYRAVAQNSYGTTYGNIVSFTTTGGISQGQAPTALTSPASYVFTNSALLNGTVNPRGSLATAWFEWGRDTNLGNRTNAQAVGSGNSDMQISSAVTGLRAGTTYYYRTAVQNSYSTAYGNTLSFVTQSAPIIIPDQPYEPTIIIQPTAGVQQVTLTPAIDNSNPKSGEIIAYTIVYRNEGKTAISNVVLKIVLPGEVEFMNSNIQPSLVQGNNLRYDLGIVPAHSQGIVTIKMKINRSVSTGSALVFNATLDYTDSKGAFQSVNSFLTVVIREGGSFSASLLGILGSLFGNWLFDLLLGLIIGFAIYHFLVAKKREEDDLAA